MSSLLIICRRPPYGSSLAREVLDIALAAGAFEQEVALYFTGDGVWQLLSQQQGERVGQKSLDAALCALPLYDIQSIYVNPESLLERGLSKAQLALHCEDLRSSQLTELSNRFDTVLNF